MKKIKLSTNAEVFYCPICKSYVSVKNAYKIEVAFNDSRENTQDGVQLYSGWRVICRECVNIIKKEDKVKGE